MSIWILNALVVFAISMVITGATIPQILRIAFRKQLFDTVDDRKIHHGAVPRLGGLAFMPAIIFSISMVAGCYILAGDAAVVSAFLLNKLPGAFGLCALLIMYMVGITDDLVGVRYRAKFLAQLAAAAFVIASGVYMASMHGLFGISSWSPWLSMPFTALMVIFITNAVNLIDGIDGLASGLAAIACAFYGCFLMQTGDYFFALVSFATLGALVPFFGFNVFGNAMRQRKIFMGDTGALTIGLILSIISIRLSSINAHGTVRGNLMALAFAPLMIPCLDVVRVYLRRLRHHTNPFLPDKTHIHHKLMDLGLSQRAALITILSLAFFFTVATVLLSWVMDVTILFCLDVAVWTAGNIWLSQQIEKRKKQLSKHK